MLAIYLRSDFLSCRSSVYSHAFITVIISLVWYISGNSNIFYELEPISIEHAGNVTVNTEFYRKVQCELGSIVDTIYVWYYKLEPFY